MSLVMAGYQTPLQKVHIKELLHHEEKLFKLCETAMTDSTSLVSSCKVGIK